MSASDDLRKHALECMRLAADYMQLAGDVRSPALQRHFLQMAREWSTRAESAPGADTRSAILRNGRTQPARGLRDSRRQRSSTGLSLAVMCEHMAIRFPKA